MSRDISSANPVKLAQFSSDGIALGETLRVKAETLRTAADGLADAGESIAGLSTFAGDFEDLVLDWLHLDRFAGGTAAAFLAYLTSNGLAGRADGIHTVANSDLAPFDHNGFADRDEAIHSAEALAERLQELVDSDRVSIDELDEALAVAERGMYDPAFAVTFSELLGVEGYVDVVATIRDANDDEHGRDGIDGALASVGTLATVLTTALGRAPGGDASGGDDDRAGPDDQVLDQDFVDDLVGDYDPGNLHDGYAHTDLSVLVGMTEPPTEIAVAIANNRLSEALKAATVTEWREWVDLAWGDERSGILTNYVEMLSRNVDASAAWLGSNPPGDADKNIHLVLVQDGDTFIDDGEALARLVENSVTHPDIHVRHDILEQAIEVVGAEGNQLGIAHMPGALAEGAAANMPFIDRRINDDWDDMHLGTPAPENAHLIHEFFREVMLDQPAAGTVYAGLETYSLDRLMAAPDASVDWTPGDGVTNRQEKLESLGAVQGLIVAAEGNAHQYSAQEYIDAQASRAASVNFLVGFAPYGAINDAADIAGGSVGEAVFPDEFGRFTEVEQLQRMRAATNDVGNFVLLALAENPERMPTIPVSEMSAAGQRDLIDWARGSVDRDDHDALRAAFGRATDALLPE